LTGGITKGRTLSNQGPLDPKEKSSLLYVVYNVLLDVADYGEMNVNVTTSLTCNFEMKQL